MTSARELFLSGRFEAAKRECAKSFDRGNASPAVALLSGRIALMSNRLDEAEKFLTAALESGARGPVAPLLAETFYRLDEFEQAALWCRIAGREVMARKLEAFDGLVPYRMNRRSGTRLRLIQVDPLPVVRLTVNHRREGYFLIDTGGPELLLDTEFANRVGATVFGFEHGTFAGGQRSEYGQGMIDSAQLGDLVVENVPVRFLRLRHLSGIAGRRRLSGIIGTTFLYHFLPTIDYPRSELILDGEGNGGSRSRSVPVERHAQVRFWMDKDHYIIAQGKVNGRAMLLFVDSGLAGGGFTCPKSTLDELGIQLGARPAVEGMGGAGTVSVRGFTVDRLGLGRASRLDVRGWFGLFPPFLERDHGYRIGGLLSHEFLKHYAVTFDFTHMKIHLRA